MDPQNKFYPWKDFASHLLAVRPRDKMPAFPGWTRYDATLADLEQWSLADYNLGLKTKFFPTFDVDIEDQALAARVTEIIQTKLGQTFRRGRANTGKVALVYRLDDKFDTVRPKQHEFEKGRSIIAVDMLGDGNQFVVQGVHPSNSMYYWTPRVPIFESIPVITAPHADKAIEAVSEFLSSQGWRARGKGTAVKGPVGPAAPSPLGAKASDPALIASALDCLPNPELAYDQWIRVGIAIKAALGDTDEARFLWLKWSAKSAKDVPSVSYDKWDTFQPSGNLGAGTIFTLARSAGWEPPGGYAGAHRAAPAAEFTPMDVSGAGGDPFGVSGTAPKRWDQLVWRPGEPDPWEHIFIPPLERRIWGETINPAPPQPWVVTDWIPDNQVTSLYGLGGVGKSILAQQLATCLALGIPWLGLPVTRPRRVAVFSCEDVFDVYWRRQEAINRVMGVSLTRWDDRVYVHDMAGRDNVLMVFHGDGGGGALTSVWGRLREACRTYRADVAIIDTAAIVFSGNENIRTQVQSFITHCLGALARDMNGAVLLLAHPSKSAVASGAGYSGSTSWHGAVRSMLSLTAYDPNMPEMKKLTRLKGNYQPSSGVGELVLRQMDVAFAVQSEGGAADKAGAEAKFLALLDIALGQRVALSVNKTSPTGTYAPRWMRTNLAEQAGPYRLEDLEAAMSRLLGRGALIPKATLDFKTGSKGKLAEGLCRAPSAPASQDPEDPA